MRRNTLGDYIVDLAKATDLYEASRIIQYVVEQFSEIITHSVSYPNNNDLILMLLVDIEDNDDKIRKLSYELGSKLIPLGIYLKRRSSVGTFSKSLQWDSSKFPNMQFLLFKVEFHARQSTLLTDEELNKKMNKYFDESLDEN